MTLQYITDEHGQTTAVVVPIEEWNALKDKYPFIEESHFVVPEWQKEIVLERMKKSEESPDRLLDWEEIKDSFRLD